MTPIDELEKLGGEALGALPGTWRIAGGVFLKMLVKSLRYLEGKLDGR